MDQGHHQDQGDPETTRDPTKGVGVGKVGKTGVEFPHKQKPSKLAERSGSGQFPGPKRGKASAAKLPKGPGKKVDMPLTNGAPPINNPPGHSYSTESPQVEYFSTAKRGRADSTPTTKATPSAKWVDNQAEDGDGDVTQCCKAGQIRRLPP